jgi:uncharacterized iron-regulated protein
MASALPANWSSADVEAERECCQDISVITQPFVYAYDDACKAFARTKKFQDLLDFTNVESEDYDEDYDDITEFAKHEEFTKHEVFACKKHEVFASNICELTEWKPIVESAIVFYKNASAEYSNMTFFLSNLMRNVQEDFLKKMITAEEQHMIRMLDILVSDYRKLISFRKKIAKSLSDNESAIMDLKRAFPCTRNLGIFV